MYTRERIVLAAAAIFSLFASPGRAETEAGLRSLLLNERNQELIDHLGTRYEIVHPFQIRKDWGRGLSTRLADGTATHIPETTILVETFEHKLQLDLELNTKLFAPTLVQLLYLKNAPPIAEQKLPENCYYQAKIRNFPSAKAAFQTCYGIRGIIFLGEKTLFIHPLYGNHSGKHPHLLYHYSTEEEFFCGNSGIFDPDQDEEYAYTTDGEEILRNKYVETALVLDQSLFEKYKMTPSEVLAAAVEIINYVDLLYRPLNTSVSLVYLELWLKDQIHVDPEIEQTLNRFKDYATERISRISVDATHLLTGIPFKNSAKGQAFLDSICTNNAVGLTHVGNIFEPHVTSFVLTHMIGHNLGMTHDHTYCKCFQKSGCIMENDKPMIISTTFSECSILDYRRALSKGYGACLFNMPTMRTSICGNGILEDPEQCDCGTAEECMKSNPCCDPMTCRLIKHAQCSSGPCCRKCKLLSPDHLCRASKGECDIPEFCDGEKGDCPEDLFKKNGAVCSGGLGYCFYGTCPVLKHQCQNIWGKEADSAHTICFERLNVLGTPNGNCGVNSMGEIAKCSMENTNCGFLQCSSGEKTPVSVESAPLHFVVHKINLHGTVHECKARTFPTSELKQGLVEEGTKCGFQRFCINQTCTSVKNMVSGKCPLEDTQKPCSGHGVCTNINTCFCDEGWKGTNCSEIDEQASWKDESDYYGGTGLENSYHGGQDIKMNANLAIIVIAASIVIGVGLVVIVVLIFFYRHT